MVSNEREDGRVGVGPVATSPRAAGGGAASLARTLVFCALAVPPAFAAAAGQPLADLSLEELLAIPVVTASKLPEASRRAPGSIYVVDEQEIARLGLRDLGDVLALVPGVEVIDPHFFLLGGQRGFVGSFSKTLLLVNGREMNNLIAGETFVSNQLRTRNVARVEIVNGPASALYGANALAGVINVITKTATAQGVEVTAGAGSWATGELGVSSGGEMGRWRVAGSLDAFTTVGDDFAGFLSDPERASPAAENNAYRHLPDEHGYRNDASALFLELIAERGGFYAGANHYRNDTGRGTSGIQWDYTEGSDHRELWLPYLGYRWTGLARDQLDGWAEYRYTWEKFWGDHTETEGPLLDPATGATITIDATEEDVERFRGFYSNERSNGSRRHEVQTEATWRWSDAATLVAGAEYEDNDVVPAAFARGQGTHPPLGPEQRQDVFSSREWGVYVQQQSSFLAERLVVTLGARYDDHEIYGGSFNPRGGVVLMPSASTAFKLLYGEAFREPNVFEQSLSGKPIRPTALRTWELGWHQQLGPGFQNQAVVFHNRADDLIVTDEVAEGGISNKGELESEGFEDVLRFEMGRLRGRLAYTYTTVDLDEPEAGRHPVFDVPEHKATLAASWSLPREISLGCVVQFRDQVTTEYHGTSFEVDDFTVVDLTLRFAALPLGNGAEARVTVENLFDTEYFHSEPRAPSVVKHPQNGRGFFASITVRY